MVVLLEKKAVHRRKNHAIDRNVLPPSEKFETPSVGGTAADM